MHYIFWIKLNSKIRVYIQKGNFTKHAVGFISFYCSVISVQYILLKYIQ